MIKYVNSGEAILEMLKRKGFTPIVIRKYRLLSESTLQKLREDKMISTDSLGKVCDMLEVKPEILVYNVTEKEKKTRLKNILKSVNNIDKTRKKV